MAAVQDLDLGVVALFGEHSDRRALEDRAELVGRARQFQAGPHELDAGARMDGQDAFGLEHPQRVPQWRDGNADELGQLALRHEGAGRDAAVEQAFQDPVIGEVAQPPAREPPPLRSGPCFCLSCGLHRLPILIY